MITHKPDEKLIAEYYNFSPVRGISDNELLDPFFSIAACHTCGSKEAGDRYDCTATIGPKHTDECKELEICVDCYLCFFSKDEYTNFLNKWAANSERLHRVGIHPYGYDPGFLCTIESDPRKKGVDIPSNVAEIICSLVKKVYPETCDDREMIEAYQKRLKN